MGFRYIQSQLFSSYRTRIKKPCAKNRALTGCEIARHLDIGAAGKTGERVSLTATDKLTDELCFVLAFADREVSLSR